MRYWKRLLIAMIAVPAISMAAQPDVAKPLIANLDGIAGDETVVLSVDSEGVIDFYLFTEARDDLVIYIREFDATTRETPSLSLTGVGRFDVIHQVTTGLGAATFIRSIAYIDGAYIYTGYRYHIDYRWLPDGSLTCVFDLEGGRVTRTETSDVVSDGVTVFEIPQVLKPIIAGFDVPHRDLCD